MKLEFKSYQDALNQRQRLLDERWQKKELLERLSFARAVLEKQLVEEQRMTESVLAELFYRRQRLTTMWINFRTILMPKLKDSLAQNTQYEIFVKELRKQFQYNAERLNELYNQKQLLEASESVESIKQSLGDILRQ